ncbi:MULTISPECIES: thiopurine S-methyltransferase [Pseudoxanthomonas]|uniref:Thiopurine S-methyltransferase n=1 Tax=Pseudoxanthomonas taiwanensis J19 TaxID=935569 RepID=A0A562E0G6_9GAMM|nr:MULTISPECIES: thiopurine S-methyltransferase [Pseudoxanthomonas]TWH15351.1 thiopurine S-methyltransferase [Pseudoxanthomonas taiwanensis J19]
MEPEFWLQRWREGRTGFHRDAVMPLLEKHWPRLGAADGAPVFVPLAGKTLDMHWLAARGHGVLGCELSPLAVEAFFAEAGLAPEQERDADGLHHRAGRIDLVEGDVFALADATLARMQAVYDRAALIALPTALRRRYASQVYGRLPRGCRGLLITLEYPQEQMQGPPFSVAETEVRGLFAADWEMELLERRDILAQEPRFVADGVTALATAVYRLRRR